MTKLEFLNALSDKLKEGMDSSQILSQVRYYQGYIDGEIARGKTEEEAVEDLGDPILIARNILESPGEQDSDSIFGTSAEDQEDAYEEGNYQGENQHSEEEVRQAAREEVPLGETVEETSGETDSGQNTDQGQMRQETQDRQQEETTDTERKQDSYSGNIPIHGEEEFEKDWKENDESSKESSHIKDDEPEMKSGTGLFHDEYGNFRWDLLGVILAFAIGLTAVIWIITKIVAVLSPVVIIILLAIIVVFLVVHFRS